MGFPRNKTRVLVRAVNLVVGPKNMKGAEGGVGREAGGGSQGRAEGPYQAIPTPGREFNAVGSLQGLRPLRSLSGWQRGGPYTSFPSVIGEWLSRGGHSSHFLPAICRAREVKP